MSMFLVVLFASSFSVTEPTVSYACAGASSCNDVHQLNCSESERIYITGGSYGYKQNCPQRITDNNCPQSEITRCCEKDYSDCFIPFNITGLQQRCFNASLCTQRGKMNPSSMTCPNTNRSVNTYTKIEYNCINREMTTAITSTNTSPSTETEEDGGDNTGGIIGAVVGIIVVVAIIVVVVVLVIVKRKKKKAAQEHPLNQRRCSTFPILDNIAGETETHGYTEVDLGDKSTSHTKTHSMNNYNEIGKNDFKNAAQCIDSPAYAEYNHLGGSNSGESKSFVDTYNHIAAFKQPHNPAASSTAHTKPLSTNTHTEVDEKTTYADYNHLGGSNSGDKPSLDNYNHVTTLKQPNNETDTSTTQSQISSHTYTEVDEKDFKKIPMGDDKTTYAEYNHLGGDKPDVTKPTNNNYNQIQIKNSWEDNYQHFQNHGKPKPQTVAEYNHIGAVNKMLDEGDYNSLGYVGKPKEVDNDNYSHVELNQN